MNDTTQQPTIETERLSLRPFHQSDAGTVQKLAGDRRVAATTLNIPHPYPDGAAEEWIGSHSGAWEQGDLASFAITLNETRELIGAIGLKVNRQHNRGELGYWLAVPYWNRGYTTEAARAMIDFGFNSLGLHRIHASYLSSNGASGKVMRKIGMKYEGCQRQHIEKWGEFHDADWYAILHSEWLERTHPAL